MKSYGCSRSPISQERICVVALQRLISKEGAVQEEDMPSPLEALNEGKAYSVILHAKRQNLDIWAPVNRL